jgi:uroporphyrinogen decarboxylase
MSFGTPADVRDEVRHRIETVGRGGGFVLAPSHVLEPEVPWANVEAFVDAARAYGTYL